MDYAQTREIIERSGFISDDDMAYVQDNIEHLQAVWESRQIYRTDTEMRVSVLNDTKFPTPASKYWQCVREQSGFYSSLVTDSFTHRRAKVKLQRKQQKLDKCEDPLKAELLRIDMEEIQFQLLHTAVQAKDRVREIRLWDTLMQECIEAEEFDTADVNTHQLISYLYRWHEQLKG